VADVHAAAPDVGTTAPGHYGVAGTQVTLGTRLLAYAWNVQGNPDNPSLSAAAQAALGVALPSRPNTLAHGEACSALWLGPRSWLVVAFADRVSGATDYRGSRATISGAGGALFDVSASRIAFTVGGLRAANVLAKSCPLDLHPRVFGPGQCAQSLLGHVNLLIAKMDSAPMFTVMVARSFSSDAWRKLCVSAAPLGYDVA
jgi:sarcosine oxidase subunit gamma